MVSESINSDILVVDDDQFLTLSLSRLLVSQGCGVRVSHSIEDGWKQVQIQEPQLLVLDLSLPDGDGIELCKRIRTKYNFPVMMLTSRGESIDKVIGLDVGGDDYLTKPFDAHEFVARVKALLRRHQTYSTQPKAGGLLEVGSLMLDLTARTASANETQLTLTHTEFDLLAYLVARPNQALHRDEIFSSVWGFSSEFSSNSLDVLMYRLRKKLSQADSALQIKTVRGHGFKFSSDEKLAERS